MPEARNNRSDYKDASSVEEAKFRADPQYLQWRDIAKSEYVLTGNIRLTGHQLAEQLKKTGRIENTEHWGWWRMTDAAWKEYTTKIKELK